MKSSPIIVIITTVLIMSCKHDERNVNPVVDNEAITTVRLQLINTVVSTDAPVVQWEQLLDKNGKPLPVDTSQTKLTLSANAAYSCHIIVLDKTQSPPDTISTEIKERGIFHLFFFQSLPTNQPLVVPNAYPGNPNDLYPVPIPTPVPAGDPLNLSISITDHDSSPQQYPIGLQSNFVTGNAGSGWLRIVLRHQPNVKNGTYAPGDTDLDVGFKIEIK